MPEPTYTFATISVRDLDVMPPEVRDDLPFGVVGLSSENLTRVYNATESRLAGIPAEAVLGEPFFLSTAQCMNNFMVAQRLMDEPELDVTLPYILTFRMRPTPVTLRLLKTPGVELAYLLIQR